MISQKTKTAITAIKVGVMALDNKKIDVRDLSEDVLLLLKKSYPEALDNMKANMEKRIEDAYSLFCEYLSDVNTNINDVVLFSQAFCLKVKEYTEAIALINKVSSS